MRDYSLPSIGATMLTKKSRYKSRLPPISVPNVDLFNSIEKGFVSFWRLYQSHIQYSQANPSRLNSTRRAHTYHDYIEETLRENYRKLSRLNKSIVTLRNVEYEEYIKNNERYERLLQLNNKRSRLVAKTLMSNKKKIGEIKVKQAEEIKPQDTIYYVTVSNPTVKGWKPYSRYGQVCIAYKDYIILFGGHNSTPLSTIAFYSVKDNCWTRKISTDLQRSYHSALLYRNHYVVMFGGMGPPSSYQRDCLNSTCVFDITSNMFKPIKTSNEELIEPRKHHGACIFGRYMVIFGGIDSHGRHLNDFKYLDLKELKWYTKEYKMPEEDLERFLEKGLGRHCMFTYFQQRYIYPFYNSDYEEKEGLYVFGGANQDGIKNCMMQFKLNKYVPVLNKIVPSGIPPSSIDPTVCRYSYHTVVIVSGDRTERQLRLYRIQTNEFIMVQNSHGLPCLGGTSSSLVPHKDTNTFYVLFGVGYQGYHSQIQALYFLYKKRENPNRLRKQMIMEVLRRYSVSYSSEQTAFKYG